MPLANYDQAPPGFAPHLLFNQAMPVPLQCLNLLQSSTTHGQHQALAANYNHPSSAAANYNQLPPANYIQVAPAPSSFYNQAPPPSVPPSTYAQASSSAPPSTSHSTTPSSNACPPNPLAEEATQSSLLVCAPTASSPQLWGCPLPDPFYG
ncbi:hypothetical protein K443DRAFT_8634 [Laccaria amethystina LaAM-08-1]|uniref:Uncharacterized protein n=1 Tax=Laccaria amethystina LaAM-08-1 TaxID=1095629 RepID=A0A0C9XNK6_9AGAR|nr:hypothetical protein K443DRAFT_8634 [Laccaria amethystina LaAM-08-1]